MNWNSCSTKSNTRNRNTEYIIQLSKSAVLIDNIIDFLNGRILESYNDLAKWESLDIPSNCFRYIKDCNVSISSNVGRTGNNSLEVSVIPNVRYVPDLRIGSIIGKFDGTYKNLTVLFGGFDTGRNAFGDTCKLKVKT